MSDATLRPEDHAALFANYELVLEDRRQWMVKFADLQDSIDRITAERDALYEALVALVAHTENALVDDFQNKAIFAAARAAIASISSVASDDRKGAA